MKNFARQSAVSAALLFLCAGAVAQTDKTNFDAPRSTEAAAAMPDAPQMKTIGVIGGVSWASSIEYYRLMNEMVMAKLGGLHSAKTLMFSIEFGEFSKQERLAEKGDWVPLRKTMLDAAARVKRGGADFLIICSNTLNSTAELIEQGVGIPVLHIADAVGAEVQKKGLKKVLLLGTKYTMDQSFYKTKLAKYGVEVVVPTDQEQDYINAVIFDELCANKVYDKSREGYVAIIKRIEKEEGVQGVILGCTEIPLLIKQKDVDIPVFDSTYIHSEAAVDFALKDLPEMKQ